MSVSVNGSVNVSGCESESGSGSLRESENESAHHYHDGRHRPQAHDGVHHVALSLASGLGAAFAPHSSAGRAPQKLQA